MEHDFYKEWFAHPEWWFSATPKHDAEIARRFAGLLDDPPVFDMSAPGDAGTRKEGTREAIQEGIAQILIYDQLPRHVFRGNREVIARYLEKALEVAEHILRTYCETMDSLTVPEWCFLLLPLRHTYDAKVITPIMPILWRLMDRSHLCEEDRSLLRRYIKATYDRCPMEYLAPSVEVEEMPLAEYAPILDHSPAAENTWCPWNPEHVKRVLDDPLTHHMTMQMEKIQNKDVLLSLSGGVDSMCLGVIMAALQQGGTIGRLAAVHVNYTNRTTAYTEEGFVRSWADHLGIPLCVRQITEIHRAPAMKAELRELYESYTRNVRYHTYKHAWRLDSSPAEIPQVLMGHNRDDCFENIMTNIVYQAKYDNLIGMDLEGIQDDIRFLRPMLEIPKSEIYAFARRHGIPHLPNSTPSWHSRGKIREKVVPTLRAWHEHSIDSFFALSHTVRDLHGIMETYVETVLQQHSCHSQTHPDAFEFPSITHVPHSALFWRALVLRSQNITLSMKSLRNLENRILRYKAGTFNQGALRSKVQLSSQLQMQIHRKDAAAPVMIQFAMTQV